MTPEEITYILHLAAKDHNPVEMLPKGFKVTKDLEAFANSVKAAMKVLASQLNCKEFQLEDIVPFSPIQFGPEVQIIMLAPLEDMQTQTTAPKQTGGLLSKFKALGSNKSEESSKEDERFYDEKKQLSFAPIALFESLHQHDYNEEAYSTYRRALDNLNNNQILCDICDEKTLAAKGISQKETTVALNEKKKDWNANKSWTLQIIQHHRARLAEKQESMRH